jgi:D-alanine transaminase
MSRIAYVNGRYLPHAEATIHIEDRGYQFADGVYEVIMLLDGRLIDGDRHLDRLQRSLAELAIRPPLSRAALLVVAAELAARNRLRSGLIYMQVTRGVARRDHAFPPPGTRSSLVVTLRRTPPFPAEIAQWTTAAITAPDQRWARCDIKSIALLPNVLAKQAARARGAGEAILIDSAGMVTEGASSSVWIVDAAGTLRTRPLGHAILPGCTRAALMAELQAAGTPMREQAVSIDDLRAASEIFLTSASAYVKPVLKLDGVAVGDGTIGPVSRAMFALMRRHVLAGAPLPGTLLAPLPSHPAG